MTFACRRDVAMKCGAALILSNLAMSAAVAASPPTPVQRDTENCKVLTTGNRILPAAVTDAMRQAVFSASVEQPERDSPSPDADRCQLPLATCSTPQPQIIRLVANSALSIGMAAPIPGVREQTPAEQVLANWQSATAGQAPLPQREFVWMSRLNQSGTCRHAIATAMQLLGPVSSSDLQRKFAWDVASADETEIILTATPKDETEGLFTPQFQVQLETAHWSVVKISVADRQGQWQTLELPQSSVQHAVVEGEVAEQFPQANVLPPSPLPEVLPAPAPLIHFAADIPENEPR